MENKIEPVLITNIQRYSLNDGPGIRTTVFMKGCHLRCPWCHNPECIGIEEDFFYNEAKCQRCGLCAMICLEGAITPPGPNGEPPVRDRSKCTRCMKCVDACPYGGLERVSQALTVEQVLDEVKRDWLFYLNSHGGMTLSGGEPLFHPEFTLELLKAAKRSFISTALDTTAHAKWEVLKEILEYTDFVLLDLKNMDSKKHKEVVGVPNELILENAQKMAHETDVKIIIRIPLIPGFNDSEENLEETAKFTKSLGQSVIRVDILPFHNWCEPKYKRLDRVFPMSDVPSLSADDVKPFEDIFKGYGFETTIGG